MPEEQNPAIVAGYETGTIDNVRLAFKNRLDQLGILGRVILKVGILHYDNIAGHMAEAGPQGRALAHVPVMQKDTGGIIGQVHQDFAAAVRGAVIDKNNFLVNRDGPDRLAQLPDRCAFVIYRYDYGELQGEVTGPLRLCSSPVCHV